MDGDVGLTGAMQGRDVRSNRMATKDVSIKRYLGEDHNGWGIFSGKEGEL